MAFGEHFGRYSYDLPFATHSLRDGVAHLGNKRYGEAVDEIYNQVDDLDSLEFMVDLGGALAAGMPDQSINDLLGANPALADVGRNLTAFKDATNRTYDDLATHQENGLLNIRQAPGAFKPYFEQFKNNALDEVSKTHSERQYDYLQKFGADRNVVIPGSDEETAIKKVIGDNIEVPPGANKDALVNHELQQLIANRTNIVTDFVAAGIDGNNAQTQLTDQYTQLIESQKEFTKKLDDPNNQLDTDKKNNPLFSTLQDYADTQKFKPENFGLDLAQPSEDLNNAVGDPKAVSWNALRVEIPGNKSWATCFEESDWGMRHNAKRGSLGKLLSTDDKPKIVHTVDKDGNKVIKIIGGSMENKMKAAESIMKQAKDAGIQSLSITPINGTNSKEDSVKYDKMMDRLGSSAKAIGIGLSKEPLMKDLQQGTQPAPSFPQSAGP